MCEYECVCECMRVHVLVCMSMDINHIASSGSKRVLMSYSTILGEFINPRRACARVTVVVLSVCLCVCVCVFPILAPRVIRRTNSSISDFSAIRA